jgi:hypothetical protein
MLVLLWPCTALAVASVDLAMRSAFYHSLIAGLTAPSLLHEALTDFLRKHNS